MHKPGITLVYLPYFASDSAVTIHFCFYFLIYVADFTGMNADLRIDRIGMTESNSPDSVPLIRFAPSYAVKYYTDSFLRRQLCINISLAGIDTFTDEMLLIHQTLQNSRSVFSVAYVVPFLPSCFDCNDCYIYVMEMHGYKVRVYKHLKAEINNVFIFFFVFLVSYYRN